MVSVTDEVSLNFRLPSCQCVSRMFDKRSQVVYKFDIIPKEEIP